MRFAIALCVFVLSTRSTLGFGGILDIIDKKRDKDKQREMVIVDADFCADDSLGLMVLHDLGHFDFKALTVTFGNVDINVTGPNALRTVKYLNLKVPVYLGASDPIEPPFTKAPKFEAFGQDAVGGASGFYESNGVTYNTTLKAHDAMIEIVNKYPGQITILAFGPLTNLALAQQKDQSFLGKTKKLFIMGGNVYGRGNAFHDRPNAGEFNFAMDPLAAQIVILGNPRPTKVYPWEPCMWNGIPFDVYEKAMKVKTQNGRVLKAFSEEGFHAFKAMGDVGYQICDLMAVFAYLDDKVVDETEEFDATVETKGVSTNGMMVVRKPKKASDPKNVIAITKINQKKQIEMLFKFVLKR